MATLVNDALPIRQGTGSAQTLTNKAPYTDLVSAWPLRTIGYVNAAQTASDDPAAREVQVWQEMPEPAQRLPVLTLTAQLKGTSQAP